MKLLIGSCAQLDPAVMEQLGIALVEYPVALNGAPWPVTVHMDAQRRGTLRRLLRDKHNAVTTSGLRVPDLVAACRELEAGQRIVSLHQPASFSAATWEALREVERSHPELNLLTLDAKVSCTAYGALSVLMARAIAAGVEEAELLRRFARWRRQTVHIGVIRDLFYLARSGRIGRGRALLGTALRLLPLLTVRDEKAVATPFGRVRAPRQANQRILSTLRADAARWSGRKALVCIAWFGEQERHALELARQIEALPIETEILVSQGQATVSVHLGPDYWEVGYVIQ